MNNIDFLYSKLTREQLIEIAKEQGETIASLEMDYDACRKNLASTRLDVGKQQEKVSDAWVEYKRSQDRVAELYSIVKNTAAIINQDGDEVSDGEVIDEIVNELSNEFEQVNGLFFIDKKGETIKK